MMKFIKKLSQLFYLLIAKHLPASYTPIIGGGSKIIRGLCAKGFLDYCGNNVNIEKGSVFSSKSRIGDNSGIGVNAHLGVVYIGDNVLMGKECIGVTRNHGFILKDELIRNQCYSEEKPIVIGNDVWIGHRVTILPGVKIADGTVIGAGSVVTKNTEPYSVVAGNPARIIKYRE